jgi:integrase
LRAFLAIGFTYGWRKSEILGLRVRHVDLLESWSVLETSKNGSGRATPLTAELRKLLAACITGKAADGFVLTHADGSPVVQPRKNWYSLCAQVGLGKFERGRYSGLTMHDLRRSAARRLVRLGIPEPHGHGNHRTQNAQHVRPLQHSSRTELAQRGRAPPSKRTPKMDTRGFAHA